MKKIVTELAIYFLVAETVKTQVGLGTTTPESSAMLEVKSTEKGFVPPRMTSAQRNTNASPQPGLTMGNLDKNCMECWSRDGCYSVCIGAINFTDTYPPGTVHHDPEYQTDQFPVEVHQCNGSTSIIDIQLELGLRYEWQNSEDRLSATDITNPEMLIEVPFTFILLAENPVCRPVSEIEVNFLTTFEIGGLPESVEVCVGDTILLNFSGGKNYDWSENISEFCVNQEGGNLIIPIDFEQWQLGVQTRNDKGCLSITSTTLFGTRDTLLNESSLMICEGEEDELFSFYVSEVGKYCNSTQLAGEPFQIDCIYLRLIPLYEIEKKVHISWGETYDFLNNQLSEIGFYFYDFINQDDCDSTNYLDLRVYQLPLIELQGLYSAMEGENIQPNLSPTYSNSQWEPALLFNYADCPEVEITFRGTFNYKAWVTDSTGCQVTTPYNWKSLFPAKRSTQTCTTPLPPTTTESTTANTNKAWNTAVRLNSSSSTAWETRSIHRGTSKTTGAAKAAMAKDFRRAPIL